jgi:hypothetical protein
MEEEVKINRIMKMRCHEPVFTFLVQPHCSVICRSVSQCVAVLRSVSQYRNAIANDNLLPSNKRMQCPLENPFYRNTSLWMMFGPSYLSRPDV